MLELARSEQTHVEKQEALVLVVARVGDALPGEHADSVTMPSALVTQVIGPSAPERPSGSELPIAGAPSTRRRRGLVAPTPGFL